MHINVLSLGEVGVIFYGFKAVEENDCVSVRILNDKLIITAGDVKAASGKVLVPVSDKYTEAPNLFSLVKRYCKNKYTAFIASPNNQAEYIQCSQIPIPDDYFLKQSAPVIAT